jgi:hypothetical protein
MSFRFYVEESNLDGAQDDIKLRIVQVGKERMTLEFMKSFDIQN